MSGELVQDSVSSEPPLLGRYQLVRVLGEGATGSVYLAHDLMLESRSVAIKLLRAGASDSALARLKEEAALTQSLNHPHIVQLYSFERTIVGEDGRNSAFLTMEYVEGTTLRQLIAQGPLATDEALRIFRQLVDGLACAHSAGIVHRDLKPDNILITTEGNVKLTDFGVAKSLLLDAELTCTGQVLGTPGYLAPELYSGSEVTMASDVYSLGLLLYEMAFGEPLQRPENAIRDPIGEASRVARKVARLQSRTPLVDLLVTLCCATAVADRPLSAVALKEQLDESATMVEQTKHFASRRTFSRRLWRVARVLTSVLLSVVLALIYLGRAPSPYSLPHLFGANIIYRFVDRSNPGLLFGVSPVDGFNYIRQRYAYGLGAIEDAVGLSEEARLGILNCGLQHRLPEFQRSIPDHLLELGGMLGKDCSSYPIDRKIQEHAIPLIAPLTLATYYGEEEIVNRMLDLSRRDQISQRIIDATIFQAVRMDRPRILNALLSHNLKPLQISDDLLVEALMLRKESCLDLLIASGAPIGFSVDFIRQRVGRQEGGTASRWRSTLLERSRLVVDRIKRLQSQGHDLSGLKGQLTPELLATVTFNHPDLMVILSALGFDWRTKDLNGETAIHHAARLRGSPMIDLLARQPSVDLNAPDAEGVTPLIRVLGQWDPDRVKLLLERGSDPNVLSRVQGARLIGSALRFSIPGNYMGIVQHLLDDPRTELNLPIEGIAPLAFSATVPTARIMQSLLDRGADPFVRDNEGRTVLHYAARSGSAAHMKLLLKRGVPVDAQDASGLTPLMTVVVRANAVEVTPAIQVLIEAGADAFRSSRSNQTAFDFALMFPKSRAIAGLLDATRFDPSTQLPDGRLLLNIAVGRGRPTAGLDELLKRGVRVRAVDALGINALHVAIRLRNPALVAQLLSQDPTILTELTGGDESYLNFAAERSSPQVVDVLLRYGARTDAKLPGGETVFTRAVARSTPEVIRMLIERSKPDLNYIPENDRPALLVASYRRDPESMKLLLDAGADPGLVVKGRSILGTALLFRDIDVLKEIVTHPNAKLNQTVDSLELPLTIAAKVGDLDVIELLLQHGANPRQLDKYGRPPLFYSYGSGRADVVERLRSAAPDMAAVIDTGGADLKEFEKIFGSPE